MTKQHAGIHRPYRPSNATEGDSFVAEWCGNCALARFDDPDRACMIHLRAVNHSIDEPEYPAEWQLSNGGIPMCSAFRTEEPPVPRCPDTIDMFD